MKTTSLRTLNLHEMEDIRGGKSAACGYVTGAMCIATIAALTSVFFTPLAAATGIGCALGAASGCANAS